MNSQGEREMVTRAVGERIRKQRRSLDLTQEDVASLAGVDRKHIGTIENGKTEPGVWTLIRIARALKIPAEQLLEGLT